MGMKVDISNVPTDRNLIPTGNYMAEITKAEDVLTKKGDPAINLVLRIEGGFGFAFVFDMLPSTMPSKVKSFYAAFNGLDPSEVQVNEVEIDPDELVGGNVIISFGESERGGQVYKQLVSPFYFPDTRVDVLTDTEAPF